MAKRKAVEVGNGSVATARRRSGRHGASVVADTIPPDKTTDSKRVKADKPADGAKVSKTENTRPAGRRNVKHVDTDGGAPSNVDPTTPPTQQYWLMKAEPESRLERGHDVKFSIDDLAARTDPEPWDGIRAYPARNNLRAMRKGDLAFFYHSNCKVPAIAGVMEVVKEHSPDFILMALALVSAKDPNAPYFDTKDTDPTNPKWSLVHVEFRRKFKNPVTLKELRELANSSGPLENMQMLKQSRLSVSKVTKDEWDFLVSFADRRDAEEVSGSE